MATDILKKLNHTIITLIIQLPLGFIFGEWLMGALIASALFIGREHAQAEYRWIENFGKQKRANLPFWGAFDPLVWDMHSFFWNLLLPVVISMSLFGISIEGAFGSYGT